MIPLHNMAIRHKLVAIAMLTCAAATLLSSGVQMVRRESQLRHSAVRAMSSYASIIGENCKAALAFEDRGDAKDTLESLRVEPSIVFACVYAKDKRVLAQYRNLDSDGECDVPDCQDDQVVFEQGRLKLSRQVLDGNAVMGTVHIECDLGTMRAAMLGELRSVALISAAALGFAFLVSVRLQRIVSGPILNLAEMARAISEDEDYGRRFVKTSNDEIGLLVDAFNELLQRIHSHDLELSDLKEELETKVAGRTGELRTANLRLKEEITQRQLIEESLQTMNEKLAQSNRQLEEFTYVASHDLREPTRKITAFGQLLEESLGDKLSDDDRENLSFMVDGADRMQRMIEALLEYSRVTTNAVNFERVDLNEIVEQLRSLELAMMLDETGCDLAVPEILPPVKGDQVQVRQLLQNLVSNAMKYQKKGVTPEVTVRAMEQDDGMVRVEVEDNGIGIKPEQQENVFVMFRRLHSREEYEGTGIGLAVCKRIIERHGGQIGVESVHGEGATFWFTVPSAFQSASNVSMEESEVQAGV